MIRSFDDAFEALLGDEKGYVENPADPGGATMYGVTERVARAWGYRGDMRDLPLDIAKQIARAKYWTPHACEQFDPRVAFMVFDAAYNGGRPAQWLQSAAGVAVDGVIGAITIAAVRALDPMLVICRFAAAHLNYYASLENEWPTFGRGWSRRVAHNLALCAE